MSAIRDIVSTNMAGKDKKGGRTGEGVNCTCLEKPIELLYEREF